MASFAFRRQDRRETMICAAVTYVIKPGHEEEAAELFRTLTEHTRAEPGCRMTWRIGRRPIPAGSSL